MSRGDVLIYAGTDPSTANAWQISGKYKLGAAIGDRPFVKLGGDLIAITSDGYIPLLQFLGAGREQRQLAISDKIAPTVTQAVSFFGSVAGWQAILFSEANWLLFNVPADDGGTRFTQHTMNVQTGAWCSFRGHECAVLGDVQGQALLRLRCRVGSCRPTPEARTVMRQFAASCARPTTTCKAPMTSNSAYLRAHIESGAAGSQVQVGASVDFDRGVPVLSPGTVTPAGTAWDTGAWDTFQWGSGLARFRHWRGVNVKGSAISVHISSFTRTGQISYFSADVVYDQVVGAIAETG